MRNMYSASLTAEFDVNEENKNETRECGCYECMFTRPKKEKVNA